MARQLRYRGHDSIAALLGRRENLKRLIVLLPLHVGFGGGLRGLRSPGVQQRALACAIGMRPSEGETPKGRPSVGQSAFT